VKADPHLLDLRKFIKNLLINNNIIKADIFIVKFFPKTGIVNFSNIKVKVITEQRAFNINFTILIEKISKLIRSFLNNKVLKLNGILNKVLKVVILITVKNLIEVASYCFINRIILKSFKEFIIVVLYKKGFFFSLLGSYRLITLKNMLAKVLEKHIANIILKVAEKHRLLP